MAGSLIHKHEVYQYDKVSGKFENTSNGELLTKEEVFKNQEEFNDWVLANPVHGKRLGKRVRKKKSHSASSRNAVYNQRVEDSISTTTTWDNYSGSGLPQDPLSVFARRVANAKKKAEGKANPKPTPKKKKVKAPKLEPLKLTRQGDIIRIERLDDSRYRIVTRFRDNIGATRSFVTNKKTMMSLSRFETLNGKT